MDKKTISFTIPLNPVTKKNSQRLVFNKKTGKPFVLPSEKYQKYERDAQFFVPNGISISYGVSVKCLFYMSTKRKVDLTNLLEAIDDVLVKCNVLLDDDSNIIKSHDGSRVYYDKENPRTEVYIEVFNE